MKSYIEIASKWREGDSHGSHFSWKRRCLSPVNLGSAVSLLHLHLVRFLSFFRIYSYYSYLELVRQYHSIISAQLFGHTHKDEFEIIYDSNNSTQTPIGISYLAPSVTPFTNQNPAVRVYEFDSDFNLIDYVQYYANLTQTQIDNKPTWYAYLKRLFLILSPHIQP